MSVRRDARFCLLAVIAATSAANAVWMVMGPAPWYSDLPAAVPDTGPYNEYFVRDIGVGAVFLAGHAALPAFDTLRGFLDADHWLLDLPGVYLPALVLTPIAVRLLHQSCTRASV